MSSFFSFFIIFVCALVAMAFYTLFERKLLGHAQIRKGPNKVGFMGLLQPFSDAMKLFLKQLVLPLHSNYFGFYFGPLFALSLSLVTWGFYTFTYTPFFFLFGGLAFLMVSSLSVYSVVVSGWCSNSKYALLGAMRSVAQTISYEISMALFFLCGLLMMGGVSFFSFLFSSKLWLILCLPSLFLVWVVTVLAETNRAPFDFAEGESELVSGFNIEYSSGLFAFIFMAEYSSILALSVLSMLLFLGVAGYWWVSPVLNSFLAMFLWGLIIVARAALPRMRYDCLMMLTWKSFLPFSLGLLMFCFCSCVLMS